MLTIPVCRVGWEWNFGFMPYGKQWRALRRLFNSKYGTSQGLRMFYDSHRVTMGKLLLSTLQDPDAFTEHLRLYAILFESPHSLALTLSI